MVLKWAVTMFLKLVDLMVGHLVVMMDALLDLVLVLRLDDMLAIVLVIQLGL